MENSKIEWTDHTFNPWIGCTKVSPGCANCYAETREDKRLHRVKWGKGQPRHRTSADTWRGPVKWNRESECFGECHHCGRVGPDPTKEGRCPNCTYAPGSGLYIPRSPRVFCASLADWLDGEVPIEWLADLLKLIHDTPNLDWLLLTKRPQNFFSRVSAAQTFIATDPGWANYEAVVAWLHDWMAGDAPGNVWLGTSVEDQQRADERIPELLRIPATVRFLSCEPLLESVDLAYSCFNGSDSFGQMPGIHWVICGGESGHHARPMHPDWARSLRDQCAAAGIPFLFKQWGEWSPVASVPRCEEHVLDCLGNEVHGTPRISDTILYRVGKHAAGRLLDGVEWSQFPEAVQ